MSAPRYILLAKFCDDVGYTIKAIERKIESGVWREGFQYRRSPDGRIQVDLERVDVPRLPAASRPVGPVPVKRRAARALPPPIRCGVYLLYNDGQLAYIGRSICLASRLAQHRASGRLTGEARVIACDETASGWLEAELIRVLQPPQNIIRYARRAVEAGRALSQAGLQ